MPLWGTVVIVGAALSAAGYTVTYLIGSSRTLGGIEQCLHDVLRRLDESDDWRKDRDAELVAYRNGYWERPPNRRRRH